MKIIIETIPHAQQRYPTCGDWFTDSDGTLYIKVSEEVGEDSAWVVAVHELIEQKLCSRIGITQQQVDDFDMAFKGEGEPGDDPRAPYFEQHQIATSFENLLCNSLGILWEKHDSVIESLP